MYEQIIFIIETDLIKGMDYDVLCGDVEITGESDTEIQADVFLDIQDHKDNEVYCFDITGGVYPKEYMDEIKEQYKEELLTQ